MKIHEYQAKAILGQYNVPVPRGEVAFKMCIRDRSIASVTCSAACRATDSRTASLNNARRGART